MLNLIRRTTLAGCVFASLLTPAALTAQPTPPQPEREFRSAWVASVANIDWPTQKTLTTAQQQKELIAILDKCKKLNINVVILQVRPACDALYASKLEPWSEFLTGTMGKAPEPFYDPLEFAVQEAHQRGLQLHAWVNPYRAYHPSGKSPVSSNHISVTKPAMVVKYGKHLWLDPGRKAVQDHTLAVIMDIVSRYDIDGMHMDDYFYPYKEKDASGKVIDFPDRPRWEAYQKHGGKLNRDDWRRDNVNILIERTYNAIKAKKPWVQFSVSPFGIWKPGYPPQIKGFNAYDEIYCDSLKWLTNGWMDYTAPQLYWAVDATAQSYPVLLKWWVDNNPMKRHVYAGNFTSRVGDTWKADEIIRQIEATRAQPGAGGNIHFSMKCIMKNTGNMADELAKAYAKPVIPPAYPWLNDKAPGRPKLTVKWQDQETRMNWRTGSGAAVWQWVVQKQVRGEWITEVHSAKARSRILKAGSGPQPDAVAVWPLSRTGILGEPAVAARQP